MAGNFILLSRPMSILRWRALRQSLFLRIYRTSIIKQPMKSYCACISFLENKNLKVVSGPAIPSKDWCLRSDQVC